MVHQRANAKRYPIFMNVKSEAVDVLVANLRALMRDTGTTKIALSKKSGVSQRMVAYILSKERTPTVDVAESLAKAFNLKGWQLMIPDINIEVAKSNKLDVLIKNYAESSDNGREFIDRVAEKESKYTREKK